MTAREVVRLAAPAMGTRFEVVLAGADAPRLRGAAEEALAEVCALSERLSAFSPGSVLSHINGRAGRGPVAVDREMFELLELCREGWRLSEGAFDVTVGPLMEAWGFRGVGVRCEAEVAEARARVGMDKVLLDRARGTVELAADGMRLDLGGVAKGFALDAAAAVARGAGVDCGLMHGGTSSVMALGAPAGERGWRVAVGADVVSLAGQALSVSAPRGRMIERDGERLGHVLDPRTGRPAMGAESAWAVCASGAWAEVWSTAMLVLGRRASGMDASVAAGIAERFAEDPGEDDDSGRHAPGGSPVVPKSEVCA